MKRILTLLLTLVAITGLAQNTRLFNERAETGRHAAAYTMFATSFGEEAPIQNTCYPYDPDIIIDGIQELNSEKQLGARKVIHGNHLYILKNGKTYSVEGTRIR